MEEPTVILIVNLIQKFSKGELLRISFNQNTINSDLLFKVLMHGW